MADMGWTARVAAAAGASAGTGAAQLGLGYGLGVVVWPLTDTPDDSVWLGSLGWATWITASATVLGAVIASRIGGGPAPSTLSSSGSARLSGPWRLSLAAAAAIGALAVVALIALPARSAVRGDTFSPQVIAAGYAIVGVLLGLLVAYWAVVSRPVAANLITTGLWLWALAISAVVVELTVHRPSATYLTSWQFTGRTGHLYGTIFWPSAVLTLAAAFVIGVIAVAPAARRGHVGLGAATSGAVGPLLVGAAFFVLAPQLTGALGPLESAYLIAPYAVIAGLAGSALTVTATQALQSRRPGPRPALPAGPSAHPEPTGPNTHPGGQAGPSAYPGQAGPSTYPGQADPSAYSEQADPSAYSEQALSGGRPPARRGFRLTRPKASPSAPTPDAPTATGRRGRRSTQQSAPPAAARPGEAAARPGETAPTGFDPDEPPPSSQGGAGQDTTEGDISGGRNEPHATGSGRGTASRSEAAQTGSPLSEEDGLARGDSLARGNTKTSRAATASKPRPTAGAAPTDAAAPSGGTDLEPTSIDLEPTSTGAADLAQAEPRRGRRGFWRSRSKETTPAGSGQSTSDDARTAEVATIPAADPATFPPSPAEQKTKAPRFRFGRKPQADPTAATTDRPSEQTTTTATADPNGTGAAPSTGRSSRSASPARPSDSSGKPDSPRPSGSASSQPTDSAASSAGSSSRPTPSPRPSGSAPAPRPAEPPAPTSGAPARPAPSPRPSGSASAPRTAASARSNPPAAGPSPTNPPPTAPSPVNPPAARPSPVNPPAAKPSPANPSAGGPADDPAAARQRSNADAADPELAAAARPRGRAKKAAPPAKAPQPGKTPPSTITPPPANPTVARINPKPDQD